MTQPSTASPSVYFSLPPSATASKNLAVICLAFSLLLCSLSLHYGAGWSAPAFTDLPGDMKMDWQKEEVGLGWPISGPHSARLPQTGPQEGDSDVPSSMEYNH